MIGPTIATQSLNAAQQQVLDQLGSTDRPEFDLSLRSELRAELTEAFTPMFDQLDPDNPLFVSKRALGLVHACEQHFVSDAASRFEWSVPSARGTVVHKAIELLVGFRGHPTPLELVHAAIARLEVDRSISDFLLALSEPERAELVALAVDQVTTFLETFPPLEAKWRPVPESRVRAEFGGGRLILSGKVDLQLGYARGQAAGKVTIDLKTGRSHQTHIDDLRFYALLDTLKTGTPPRLLVSYYLDSGTPHTEAVTTDLLWAAAQRTAEAVARICELGSADVEPERRAGGTCTYCPLNESCSEGIVYLTERSGLA